MGLRLDNTELLAPAGSLEALKLAVNHGADAVYFGAGNYHARRATENIDIAVAVEYCHLYGVKAYLTLNINLKDAELLDVQETIKTAYNAKIDAFIVTDLGLLLHLFRLAPGVALHASTQLGVASKSGAEFLKSLGFSRVVLAREAGLEEIKAVKSTGLEVEYFVHGALCVAFSGSCLMSSIQNGDSGNRGVCKQLCRLSYRIKGQGFDNKTAFFLSPKDQCLINHLNELHEIGVDSFKIEGRLKREVYAGGVTAIYRKAINAEQLKFADFSKLKRLFNRGNFSAGYAYEKNDAMMYYPVQSSMGEKAGEIVKVSYGKAYFRSSEFLEKEDGFKFLRMGKEFECKTGGVLKGQEDFYYFISDDLKIGDEVRITNDKSVNTQIAETQKHLPISLSGEFLVGKPIKIEAECEGFRISSVGAVAEKALNAPLSKKDLEDSVSRLGDTIFSAESIKIKTDNVFIRKSELNALRRDVTYQLKAAILLKNEPKRQVLPLDKVEICKNLMSGIFVEVDTIEKAFVVPNDATAIVFRPTEYKADVFKTFSEAFREKRPEQTLLLFTPPMLLEKDERIIKYGLIHFDGLIANSLSAVKIAKDTGKLCVGGVNLNIMNHENPLVSLLNAYTVSVECNRAERKTFSDGIVYAYGKLPLMYLRHCPKKSNGMNCKNCNKEGLLYLKDSRYEFPLRRFEFGSECRFSLLNAVNADLGLLCDYKNIYLDFSETEVGEIEKVYRDYQTARRLPSTEHTALHSKRGVR